MKKTCHKIIAFTLLLAFLFVQVPAELFHHHDHEPVCELSDPSHHQKVPEGTRHFHENESVHCFVCSAQLIKEYSTKEFFLAFTPAVFETHYTSLLRSLSSISPVHASSRAPPFIS